MHVSTVCMAIPMSSCTCKVVYILLGQNLLSFVGGAGGFLVAQFVLIGLLPSHWPFMLDIAVSASWKHKQHFFLRIKLSSPHSNKTTVFLMVSDSEENGKWHFSTFPSINYTFTLCCEQNNLLILKSYKSVFFLTQGSLKDKKWETQYWHCLWNLWLSNKHFFTFFPP